MSSTDETSALAQRFVEAVDRFRAWASSVPEGERSAEWEDDYPDWPEIYSLWRGLVAARPAIRNWEYSLVETALYAIARDNECQILADEVPRDSLRFLAERASASSEPDAKWQLAVELGETSSENEDILLTLANDQDEYVRRRALKSLARIRSTFASQLAVREWDRAPDDFPWSRMNALWVLHYMAEPSLEDYMAQARNSPSDLLREYAEKVERGEIDV